MRPQRLLIIHVAGLGHDIVTGYGEAFARLPLRFAPLGTVFPAVTCTAQATFRTALPPARHGIVANGIFDRQTRRTEFWNQSAALLPPGRIWDGFRRQGRTVGTLFWQQSLGDAVDLVLSPAPIHKHHGGMIQDCYAEPAGLYAELCQALRRPFNLMRYWGPLAAAESTRWIAAATAAVTRRTPPPDLLLTYLPHLDYPLQKYGPDDRPRIARAVAELVPELLRLLEAADSAGYAVLVWGDYAIGPATKVVFPNRVLREAGLFRVRQVGRRLYPDLYASRAFALVDHQVAHVYVTDPADTRRARACLAETPGIAHVLDHAELDHPRSGELILVAAPGAWFAYPWWDSAHEAPDYATHVDIHSKPGFDPCELFWGWPPFSVSRDATRVKGTHGRTDRPACFATNLELAEPPADLLALSLAVRQQLEPR